jgi:hypothetical protein
MSARILLVGLILLAGEAGIAQPLPAGTGSRIHSRPDSDYSNKETRILVDDYGKCIVGKQAKRAAEAIVRNVNNNTLMREYASLIDGSCMQTPPGTTVQVRFEGDQFRYAIADALVRKELGALPAPVLTAVPPLDHRVPAPPSRLDKKGRPVKDRVYADAVKHYEQDQAFSYLSGYGECVVRNNPAGARALLLTRPETDAENAGFAALKNAFASCLEEGRTLAFGKVTLRGTIAINYYRLARAAAALTVGAAK